MPFFLSRFIKSGNPASGCSCSGTSSDVVSRRRGRRIAGITVTGAPRICSGIIACVGAGIVAGGSRAVGAGILILSGTCISGVAGTRIAGRSTPVTVGIAGCLPSLGLFTDHRSSCFYIVYRFFTGTGGDTRPFARLAVLHMTSRGANGTILIYGHDIQIPESHLFFKRTEMIVNQRQQLIRLWYHVGLVIMIASAPTGSALVGHGDKIDVVHAESAKNCGFSEPEEILY